jgi:hypothetical protein
VPRLPVFTKRGDSRAEVDAVLDELALTPEEAGLQKYIYATQANQTVVMISSRDAPLARSLRNRAGWVEPVEEN